LTVSNPPPPGRWTQGTGLDLSSSAALDSQPLAA
jgi:hypothetical protein